jgi:hypothetical protein
MEAWAPEKILLSKRVSLGLSGIVVGFLVIYLPLAIYNFRRFPFCSM